MGADQPEVDRIFGLRNHAYHSYCISANVAEQPGLNLSTSRRKHGYFPDRVVADGTRHRGDDGECDAEGDSSQALAAACGTSLTHRG